MTSESPDNERELLEPPRQRVAGPLLCSLAFHGIVLLLLTRTMFSLSPGADAEERPGIRVALAIRQAPAPPEPDIAESAPPELSERVPTETVEEPETPPLEPGIVAEAAPEIVAEAAPAASNSSPDDEVSEQNPEPDAAPQAWTPARIRAAIESSTSALRRDVTEQWMEECIIERKERGTRDCEQQLEEQDYDSADMAAARAAGVGTFAGVTRANRKWIVEEQFRRKNDMIRGLIDEEGILGEVASIRYYINRDNISYLSGYFGDYVFDAMGNFTADVLGGTRMIVGAAGGNTAFNCAKMVTTESGRKVKVPAPCIYEYTGFEIKRPEEEPDPKEFRVVPQVFGSAR